MIKHITTTPGKALEKLKAGNARYIDAKVNSEDSLVLQRLLTESCGFFKGKAQSITAVSLNELWSRPVCLTPMLPNEIGILLSEPDFDPHPVVFVVEL